MQIDTEDFRVVTESYGMQLDDDSILAIFSKVCYTRPLASFHWEAHRRSWLLTFHGEARPYLLAFKRLLSLC
jgi:hypothetical protein